MEFMQSEWNEQVQYSTLFFKIMAHCRMSQINRDIEEWRRGIEGKISMIMGIADDKEMILLNNIRKEVNKYMAEYNMLNRKNKKQVSITLESVISTLIYAEAKIDTIANKHMPFLKIKQEVDIKGL